MATAVVSTEGILQEALLIAFSGASREPGTHGSRQPWGANAGMDDPLLPQGAPSWGCRLRCSFQSIIQPGKGGQHGIRRMVLQHVFSCVVAPG